MILCAFSAVLFDMYDVVKDTFMSRDGLELFLESLVPDLKDLMPPGGEFS